MGEHPYHRFFRRVSFQLDFKLWRKMPRHPFFKHEYLKGRLHWTPRPNTCDAFLELDRWQMPLASESSLRLRTGPLILRALQDDDWRELPGTFCAASTHWPPLSQWHGSAALRAARCIMEWAQRGRDGPLIVPACHVAVEGTGGAAAMQRPIVGAAIVTLIPSADLQGLPPTRADFMPHLDWIFVTSTEQRRGIATRLLAEVVEALRARGHRTLASTILTGNPPALLWHWSSGFRLSRRP